MKPRLKTPDTRPPDESLGATEAQRAFGSVLDRVEEGSSITITRKGKPVAVLIPVATSEPPPAQQEDILASLRAEFDRRFERMQTPEARAAVDALFKASPKELGLAAVKAAQRAKKRPE